MKMIDRLTDAGINAQDYAALRRISNTLHRWHERECGTATGCIDRDDVTGKPYWLDSRTLRQTPIRDLETGALKRLNRIMARYPGLFAYVQGDPRGRALYIVRASDIPAGRSLSEFYIRGIAVF